MLQARPRDDAATLFDAASAGNPLAASIIDQVGARPARGLAAVSLLLDPDLVVIGGGVSHRRDGLRQPTQPGHGGDRPGRRQCARHRVTCRRRCTRRRRSTGRARRKRC
ncbi:ROK family protein [Actinoallomurus sp. NPDC052274]|uniref:ROK family protein n=1 Tax=Actinoallomurus sp. NPDC052274 TaxID=3155420 RepID=UPI00343727D7